MEVAVTRVAGRRVRPSDDEVGERRGEASVETSPFAYAAVGEAWGVSQVLHKKSTSAPQRTRRRRAVQPCTCSAVE